MLDCTSESIFPDHFMQLVVTLNYWILATSYFGISVLTCYAVRLPLRYKLGLSMGRVTRAITFGWIIMIVILVCAFKAG
uniref:G-protein coupled receptors family 1 profile domain-containing protein n=2 Tax=Panagrolaimus sp. PS1159 TaxID=55785 RepID=A0AC35GQU3_9BILA